MNYTSFSPLYVNLLTINGLYSLNKSTIELAKPILNDLGPVTGASLAELELSNQALGKGMNKSQKSALSTDVKQLDIDRDNCLSENKRITNSYLKSSNPAKRSAASTMHLFLVPYKDVADQPVNIETGTVSDMVIKYKANPALIAAATELGIDGVFSTLELKNNALNDIYQGRIGEYAARATAPTKVKPAAVNAFIQFCTSLEQSVNYTPTDTTRALFNKLDELRKKYHALEGVKDTPDVTNTPV